MRSNSVWLKKKLKNFCFSFEEWDSGQPIIVVFSPFLTFRDLKIEFIIMIWSEFQLVCGYFYSGHIDLCHIWQNLKFASILIWNVFFWNLVKYCNTCTITYSFLLIPLHVCIMCSWIESMTPGWIWLKLIRIRKITLLFWI